MIVLIFWIFLSFVLMWVLLGAILAVFYYIVRIGEHGIQHPGPYPNVPRKPARWIRDPTGRHEYRYWDGNVWTDQVSDNEVITCDPFSGNQ